MFRFHVVVLCLLACLSIQAQDREIVRGKRPIPNRYIVVLNPAAPAAVDGVRDDIARFHGATVRATFRHVFQGFSIEASEAIARAITRDPRVGRVEQDAAGEMARDATNHWGLDRIDDRFNPRLDTTYYGCETGNGVAVYIFDTGIWAGHTEFSNLSANGNVRVQKGYDAYRVTENTGSYPWGDHSDNPCALSGQVYPYRTGNGPEPFNAGHGTAVASIVGGQTLGVARHALLRPVRIANCDGVPTAENVAQGADWILGPYSALTEGQQNLGTSPDTFSGRKVANMSFTIEYPASVTTNIVDDAVNELLAAEVVVVAAAGNHDREIQNATSYFTPARIPGVITVAGSMGENPADQDLRWTGGTLQNNTASNYGPEVDIFAPAANIRTAHWNPPCDPLDQNQPNCVMTGTDVNGLRRAPYNSGTSFAAPFVAGAAARILETNPTLTAQQIASEIIADATTAAHGLNMWNAMNSPQRLLWTETTCRKRAVSH